MPQYVFSYNKVKTLIQISAYFRNSKRREELNTLFMEENYTGRILNLL